MVKINYLSDDKVIDSKVGIGVASYEYAVDSIFPLINRFGAQRKLQDKKFYSRLRRDILDGCLMPPITLAFVVEDDVRLSNVADVEIYVNEKIESGFVLDGMQRLNALKTAMEEEGGKFPKEQDLFVSIILAHSKDKLIYRMITLNNGQRPMTARHQIEILTQELFDFEELDIDVQSEKERGERIVRGSFNLSDISSAYIAFLTDSLIVDNNKIIGERMDQILIGKIMDQNISSAGMEFNQVLSLIDGFSQDDAGKKWLKVSNNLIGFSVGVRRSYSVLAGASAVDFGMAVSRFDLAFKALNPAKVNIGRYRRELSRLFIERYEHYSAMDIEDIEAVFAEVTASYEE